MAVITATNRKKKKDDNGVDCHGDYSCKDYKFNF